MRVVVTRPEISAQRTAERLKGLGHQPVLLPLSKAVHHPQAAEHALATPHAALAITSAEAVRVLAALGERLTPFLDETVFAVGEATASAAEEAGFRNIRVGAGTGTDLAGLIAGYRLNGDAPLVYLAGNPRSPKFEEGLSAKGWSFRTADIYQMAPIAHDENAIRNAILAPPADAVLLYSRENARLFFDLATPFVRQLPALRFLCLSDTIAQIIPLEFHQNIQIARQPDENGLFALL